MVDEVEKREVGGVKWTDCGKDSAERFLQQLHEGLCLYHDTWDLIKKKDYVQDKIYYSQHDMANKNIIKVHAHVLH